MVGGALDVGCMGVDMICRIGGLRMKGKEGKGMGPIRGGILVRSGIAGSEANSKCGIRHCYERDSDRCVYKQGDIADGSDR
jgi:hypothetical protein